MTYIDINFILFIINAFYFWSILDIFSAAMFLSLARPERSASSNDC